MIAKDWLLTAKITVGVILSVIGPLTGGGGWSGGGGRRLLLLWFYHVYPLITRNPNTGGGGGSTSEFSWKFNIPLTKK